MRRNNKILHFHPNGVMASIFVGPLIECERAYGHDSMLITSIYPTIFGDKIIPFDLTIGNLPFLPLAFIKTCLILAKYKPNLVICHNSKSSLIPLFAAWLMGISRRIYFNHGVPYVGYRGFLKKLLQLLELFNFYFSTNIITVSSDMKLLLENINNKKKISIIGPGSASGLDLEIFSSEKYSESSFRASHGLSTEDFIVAFIGRPHRRKGFEIALSMWIQSFHGDNDKLVLCGPEEVDVIKILGHIPSNIICLGFVKNIPEILANIDCLILPSFHEGLSYVVLEAMASKCIVVANNIAGIKNIIYNGVNGFLITNNSLADYYTIISQIKNKSVDLDAIKNEGFKTAELYSREFFMKNYLNFLSTIL